MQSAGHAVHLMHRQGCTCGPPNSDFHPPKPSRSLHTSSTRFLSPWSPKFVFLHCIVSSTALPSLCSLSSRAKALSTQSNALLLLLIVQVVLRTTESSLLGSKTTPQCYCTAAVARPLRTDETPKSLRAKRAGSKPRSSGAGQPQESAPKPNDTRWGPLAPQEIAQAQRAGETQTRIITIKYMSLKYSMREYNIVK